MQAERWRRVAELFEAAQRIPAADRAEFLKANEADPDLLAEVESMLKAADTGDPFLDHAPFSSIAEPPEALKPRDKLGAFEIVRLLGRGGMGEVYRARDARLDREVAIKLLLPAFASDADRLARFEREARTASALNHPNIVSVHDVSREGELSFIVTELVEGETLQPLIGRGPLPAARVVDIGRQIADGLAAAHAAGIVHRDLKPGNIMVRPDGRVKILDFGLARRQRPGPESTTLTGSGMLLGTVAYMSPEQVRGQAIDPRSDIFSFGAVLYEMLGGTRAFAGPSSVEVMHAILNEQPPRLPATVPGGLEHIVRRCLEKDAGLRFQTADDLAFALKNALLERPRFVVPRSAWLIFAGPALLAAGSLFLVWLSRPLPLPRAGGIVQITHTNDMFEHPPFTSDGSHLFFHTNGSLPAYQVSAKGGEATQLQVRLKDAVWLLDINPDRTEFLLCRPARPGCELWIEPMIGGAPRRLGNLVIDNASATWAPDGRQIVFVRDKGLHLADGQGKEIRSIASVAEQPDQPRWSPDGLRIRFTVSGVGGKPSRIWEAQTDGSGVHMFLPNWDPSWNMHGDNWTPGGEYFVFEANQRLWIVRERAGLFHRTARPGQLDTGILSATDPLPSADGKRVFFLGWAQDRNEFLRYDFKSDRFALELPGVSGTELEYSKDGKWITYVSVPDRGLFRSAADGSERLQLTAPPFSPGMPRWSPDGSQIAFQGSAHGEQQRIFIVGADGGTPRQVSHGEGGERGDGDPSWAPDGRALAFGATVSNTTYVARGQNVLHLLDLKSGRIAPLFGSQGLWAPRWSPDGRFIAAQSTSASALILYDVRSQTQAEIFKAGIGCPTWSRDGESLFFSSMGKWWRLRMRDRKIEVMNELKNMALAGWGWFSIAPNDSLITARHIGDTEIYALDLDFPR
jgi:serine/threonine protein kinase/dipeptidyl aminopeptidase/acylaminoacyl peptidase